MATAAAVWAALLWWSGFSVAMAQQVPPHVFAGTAVVDGNHMANGTPVTAWINGDTVGESVVDGGTYTLLVVQPTGRSFDGKQISFKIGNLEAHEVGYWAQGGGTELHLTGTTSGSHPGEVKSTQGGTPDHTRTDCAQNIGPGCQNYNDGLFVGGASEGGKPVDREVDVRHAATVAEQTPNVHQISLTPLQESRFATRRLELIAQRELEQQRIVRERQSAARETQLELERQRLDPEYPDLKIFRIEGRPDQARKAVSRVKAPSGRGFFTNSANGDVGAIDGMLDPVSLAVIGILLTLVATSASLFKGN